MSLSAGTTTGAVKSVAHAISRVCVPGCQLSQCPSVPMSQWPADHFPGRVTWSQSLSVVTPERKATRASAAKMMSMRHHGRRVEDQRTLLPHHHHCHNPASFGTNFSRPRELPLNHKSFGFSPSEPSSLHFHSTSTPLPLHFCPKRG